MENWGVPNVQRGIPVEASPNESLHTGHAGGTGAGRFPGEGSWTADPLRGQKRAANGQVSPLLILHLKSLYDYEHLINLLHAISVLLCQSKRSTWGHVEGTDTWEKQGGRRDGLVLGSCRVGWGDCGMYHGIPVYTADSHPQKGKIPVYSCTTDSNPQKGKFIGNQVNKKVNTVDQNGGSLTKMMHM